MLYISLQSDLKFCLAMQLVEYSALPKIVIMSTIVSGLQGCSRALACNANSFNVSLIKRNSNNTIIWRISLLVLLKMQSAAAQ